VNESILYLTKEITKYAFLGSSPHRLIGCRILKFDELSSTNLYAQQLLAKTKPKEGTAISTPNQTNGRGQIGRSWESEKGKNLTFSLILYPEWLSISDQFYLSMSFSLAITDLLEDIGLRKVKIKWPNDIYIANNKVAGILIQNSIQGLKINYSIVGIGLNVNQCKFHLEIPNPTSLQLESGRHFDLNALSERLFSMLEKRYSNLKERDFQNISREYHTLLFKKDHMARFEFNGMQFDGVILGVDPSGKIRIRQSDRIQLYSSTEIRFIL
jgi:BirA family biotin operon repressor/biotin-[acetyl-CoA-carboxylase] ligase